MRQIDFIALHCSDSDIPSHDDISVIKKWHLKRGFYDVGYHFFIKKNGEIQIGRPIHVAGAHIAGHNKNSIGICLSGRHEFTDAQFDSCAIVCRELLLEFGLDKIDILGHNELDSKKTCPNFKTSEVIRRIAL